MILPCRLGAIVLAAGLFCLIHTAPYFVLSAPASELTEHYARALQLDPDDDSLRYAHAVCLLGDGETEQAVSELLRVYPAYADSIDANYNLGLAYSRLGDADNAMLYLEQAETLGALEQPDQYPLASLYFNIALIYNDKNLLDEAGRALERVLTLAPRRQEAMRLLADVLARNGQTDKAQTLLHEYLTTYPQDSQMREYLFALYYNRALADMEAGRRDEARTGFTAALKLDPASTYTGYYLGYLDYQAGDFARAATTLIKAASTAPPQLAETIPAMLYNCGLSLLEQKQPEQAAPIAAYLIAQPQPPLRDLFLAGNIRLARKDYPGAAQLYKEILKQEPGHRGAVNNLMVAENAQAAERMRRGQELFRNEQYREALSVFEQILAFNASYPLARQYAEESRKAVGDKAAALFSMAEQRMQQGALTEALQFVNRGLELTPGAGRGKLLQKNLQDKIAADLDRRFAAAFVNLDQGKFVEADQSLTVLKGLAPDDPRLSEGLSKAAALRTSFCSKHLAEGDQALAQQAVDQAEQSFSRILALIPEQPEAAAGLARTRELRQQLFDTEVTSGRQAFAAGDAELGRRAFNRALALRDDAAVRAELKRFEDARTEQIQQFLDKAGALLAKGEFKKCRGQLAQAAAIAPNDPALIKAQQNFDRKFRDTIDRHLADAAGKLQAGNQRGALSAYRTVLELEPGNTSALKGIEQGKDRTRKDLTQLVASGTSALDRGELDKADSFFHKALELDPYHGPARSGSDRVKQLNQSGANATDANALYLKGIDSYTKGSYEEAIRLWEKVLIVSPQHEKARMNIEKAKRKLRQIEEFRNG